MTLLFRAFVCILPWPLRRWALNTFCGYKIHKTARMGICFAFPRQLIMEEGTRIGNLTICKNLDLIHMKAHSRIGRGNWITGFPSGPSPHFAHEPERRAELILGEHSAITNRHLIDCTARVSIGKFTTFAGFQSQILTHSIDLEKCRQSSAPVTIGDFCFLGTNCVLLGGSVLPGHSVLGAKSLLNKSFTEPYSLYAGVPARLISRLPEDYGYFRRDVGVVT
jgi:acetyltransferase-like isoleucine patch superfamily enzyme